MTIERVNNLPWEIPVPSTSFLSGPTLKNHPQGWALRWEYEGDSEFVKPQRPGTVVQELIFEKVAAYKCTYGLLCRAAMINLAYDKLVDLGETEWLTSIRSPGSLRWHDINALRHVAIFFDEGPCYEFLCQDISIGEEFSPR